MATFERVINKFYEPIAKAEKNVINDSNKSLDDEVNLRVMSWEYCRDAFLKAYEKKIILNKLLQTKNMIILHYNYLPIWQVGEC